MGWLDAFLDALDAAGRGLPSVEVRAVEAIRSYAELHGPSRAPVPSARRDDRLDVGSGIGGGTSVGGQCPACRSSLRPAPVAEGADIAVCPGGCGLLVPGPALRTMESDPPSPSALDRRLGPAEAPAFPRRVEYRKCPSCGGWMRRLNYMKVSGIIVDVCSTHGMWCDPGELHAVLRFLADGGEARARRFVDENRSYDERTRRSPPNMPYTDDELWWADLV